MPSCAFKKCTNNSRNTNKANGITFHRFPKDTRLKEKWLRVIQLDQKDEQWLPSDYTRICSEHFKEDDFFLTALGRRKIQACAIPSFCPTVELKQEPKQEPKQEEYGSGELLSDVYVSDTDSIFDTPRKIHLKEQLLKEKCKINKLKKENLKLKKQNKNLKSTLRQLLKNIKNKK